MIDKRAILRCLDSIRAEYNDAYDVDSEAFECFNTAKYYAGCSSCDRFIPLDSDFQNMSMNQCTAKKECQNVVREFNALRKVRIRFLEISEKYSREVFNTLKDYNLQLIDRVTGEKLFWNSIYDKEYEKLTDDLKESLIPLIEEDGGKYRITW